MITAGNLTAEGCISYRPPPDSEFATDKLAAAKNVNVILMIDGCYAGGMLLREFSNVSFIGATQANGVAAEVLIDGTYYGAGSAAFAEAIEGAADLNNDGFVTRGELFRYVETGIVRYGTRVNQRPQFYPAPSEASFVALPLLTVPGDAELLSTASSSRATLLSHLADRVERSEHSERLR